MENKPLADYLKNCEIEFKQLLGISNFPKYDIIPKEITLDKSENKGFDSWATVFYDVSTGSHRLEIWNKIHTIGSSGKYNVFHEFTHILDNEVFVSDEKQYVANHGYTEYHASQVELMFLVGAKHLSEKIHFSMNDLLDTLGDKTVKQFTEFPLLLASALINRSDFPVDIETLKVTLGLIFNYYGRRSICNMYSHDYYDSMKTDTIAKLIYPETVDVLNGFMTGWFDINKVKLINDLYFRIIISLIKKYNLKD